jgi:hypothetical protein
MLNRNPWLLLVALLASTAEAKGPVVRIEIRDGVHAPLVISDAAIVGRFSIWNGPSVRTFDARGVENPQKHVLDIDDGRFIDWPAGVVRQHAVGLPRFEVSFYVETPRAGLHEYIVAYEIDAVAKQGYIYLPRWENSLIWHGVEGDWMPASDRWDELVMPLAVEYLADGAVSAAAEFRCGGTARIDAAGTIDIQFSRDGTRTGRFRYTRDSEGYDDALAQLPSIDAGIETKFSCWPPGA